MDLRKRKMAFYEVGKEDTADGFHYPVAEGLQKAFETAQKRAEEAGVKSSFTFEMTIYPRTSKKDKFGGIEFKIKESLPPRKSIKFTTELNSDGTIVDSGESKLDIDQLGLQFPKEKIIAINSK